MRYILTVVRQLVGFGSIFLVLAGCNASSPVDAAVDAATPADLKPTQDDLAPPALPASLACFRWKPQSWAADPITFIGHVSDTSGGTVAGVLAEVRRRGITQAIASGTTDADGTVELSFSTGGKQPEAFSVAVLSTKQGFISFRRYLPPPLAASERELKLYRSDDLDRFYGAGGIDPTPGMATLSVGLYDCASERLAGASVAVSRGGPVVYPDYSTGVIAVDPTQEQSGASGAALVYNVPPGETEVVASFGLAEFLRFTVDVSADEWVAVATR